MKNVFAMMMFCVMLLQTGCIYQADKRPMPSDNEVWVCKEPRMEFYWSRNPERQSVVYINGEKQYVYVSFSAGGVIIVEDKTEYEKDKYNEKFLFKGHTNFKKDGFDVEVLEDNVNLFGGELPEIHFEKINYYEYFAKLESAE